jgi:hypothetical protein
MTRDFLTAEALYKADHKLEPSYKLPAKDLPLDFPIERARLRQLPWIAVLFATSTAAYGFSLASPSFTSKPGWLAVPLVLQFFIAATSNAVFALNQTLVSDLSPGRGASATAVNNLVRCGLGAIGVAFVEMMTEAAGVMATFVVLGLVVVACAPLPAINWYWGGRWRAQRAERKSSALEEKKAPAQV